jgi:hypothetical protein
MAARRRIATNAFAGSKNPVLALVIGVIRMPTWNCSKTKKTKSHGSRRWKPALKQAT